MKLKKYLDFIDNKKIWNILRLYHQTKGTYTGADVSRILKANKMTTIKLMNHLSESGIFDKERIGNTYIYKYKSNYLTDEVIEPLLNQEANLFSTIKGDLYRGLKRYLIKGYIFGSYVKEKETIYSDIDVCIVVKSKTKKLEEKIEEISERYINYYGVKLSPYILTEEEFNEKRNTRLIKNILKEGEVLTNG